MRLLQSKYSVDELWLRGQDFIDQFNGIWSDGVWLEGYPSRGVFKGDPLTKATFFQEACKAGVLFGPSWFFNFAHFDEYKSVLSLCRDILVKIRNGGARFEGELPRSPFSQVIREQPCK